MKKNTIFISLSILILIVAGAIYFFNKQEKIPGLSPRSHGFSSSGEFINAQRAVDYYREQIEKEPDNIRNYIELSQLFLQEARITGMHHEYLPKAEILLEEALDRKPNDLDANVTKASIYLTLHQFEKAKEIIEKAAASDPYYAFAYGVLCDVYVEMGEYDKAVEASDKMLSIRPDLRSYSRASYLREIHGDNKGAVNAMLLAANAGAFGQENRAWVLYNLGNLLLNEGKLDSAKFIFAGILEERPGYAYAMAGLANVESAKENYSKAIEYLVKAAQFTPEHIFIEQLADIYAAMGNKENEKDMVEKAVKAFEQHEEDGWNIDKEYALFCANHEINLEESLERIKREYKTRPENIDVLDAYAWVLHKNGKSKEAIKYVEEALRLNTQNSDMFYRAGIIYKAAGESDMALKYLNKAFEIDPYINVLYVEDARKIRSSLSNIVSAL